MPKPKKSVDEKSFEVSFGALESPIDYRTITAEMLEPSLATGMVQNSAQVDLNVKPMDSVYHQKKIGICTACAVFIAAENYFKDGVELCPAWLYLIDCIYVKKAFYEGSSAFNALKAGTNIGIPSKAMLDKYPLLLDGTYDEYVADFKKKYKGKIPQEILDDAAKHKLPGFVQIPVNPTRLAAEIVKGNLLISRMSVGSEWWRNAADTFSTWDPVEILPLRTPKEVTSGHLVSNYGYDNYMAGRFLIKGRNSWSKEWGDRGNYWFWYDDQIGYYTEAWVIQEIPAAVRAKVKEMPAAQDFKYNFTKAIKKGDVGTEVKNLQIALCISGVLDLFVDELGTYGPKTASAVMTFQKMNKVASDQELINLKGELVGPATRKALNKLFNK